MAKIRLSYRQRQTLIDLHSLLLDLDADVRERQADTQHACAQALEAARPALKAAGYNMVAGGSGARMLAVISHGWFREAAARLFDEHPELRMHVAR